MEKQPIYVDNIENAYKYYVDITCKKEDEEDITYKKSGFRTPVQVGKGMTYYAGNGTGNTTTSIQKIEMVSENYFIIYTKNSEYHAEITGMVSTALEKEAPTGIVGKARALLGNLFK